MKRTPITYIARTTAKRCRIRVAYRGSPILDADLATLFAVGREIDDRGPIIKPGARLVVEITL